MHSKYIFLDTNNWIYLSNGFDIYARKHSDLSLRIFEIIKKRVEENNLTFLTNDIVLEEWERNKSQASQQIKELEKKINGYRGSLKSMHEFISDKNNCTEVENLSRILEEKYNEKVEKHKSHIENVDHFLKNSTVKIPISDVSKIEASDLALKKKAPFIGEKQNSMADALILLSSIEFIYENYRFSYTDLGSIEDTVYFPETFFVSSNNSDFCSPNDREIIHPDLEVYLMKTNTKFFFSLGKLINSLEVEFLTVEEQFELDHINYIMQCENCYFNALEFSDYFEIFNPNKYYANKNQYLMDFEGQLDDPQLSEATSPMMNIRTAECANCFTQYIECECGEMTEITEENIIFECQGNCGLHFRANADCSPKGIIDEVNYEIVKLYRCITCLYDFEFIDSSGSCNECAEYNRKIDD